MATGPLTQIADIVVPQIFTPYVQQLTEQKARLVQSGVLARDGLLDQMLSGGGLTFNVPSFRDLDDDADNVSSDAVSDSLDRSTAVEWPDPRLDSAPLKIETDTEIAIRLSRNNSWSSADLAAALAGVDPMQAIANRVAFYWTRRLQAAFVATVNGFVADNTANDSADYTNNISGGGFVDGVTNFSAEAFIDAATTLGDSADMVTVVMVHSMVFARMQKNNLIDFIPDARGEVNIPTFLGREVIVDDGVPVTANVYDTWLFGMGATRLGVGTPKVATEVDRLPAAGNGGGQEVLHSRVQWMIHPVGHAYIGVSPPNGGPNNTSGTAPLNAAASWNRVWATRKQIPFARLVTREA